MTSVALSVLVMCQLFCSVPLPGVCGYGVDPYGQFWGAISFFIHHCLFHFCVFSVFLGRCERVAGYVLQV